MRKAALIFAALSGLRTSPPTGAQTIPYIWTAAGDGFNGSAFLQNRTEESRISTLCIFFMRHPQYVSRSGRVCSTPKALYPR